METTITITTINEPIIFLQGLCQNIRQYNHAGVDIIIIGDKKTPDITNLCQTLTQKYTTPIEYLDVEKQSKVLPPALLAMFDYNTPDRTILGGMLAYLRGSQRIIAVDDDNFVTEDDFMGWHSEVGKVKTRQLVKSNTGWFNVHESLLSDIEFYPRGFPFGQRHKRVKADVSYERKRTAINQGLVLGDPDIDAIQRLAHPIVAGGMSSRNEPQYGLLETWSPFNYQNTCLCRELIPCYFRPKSGLRNADIWTAYIFNRLVEHIGDVITFGHPLVRQERNKHNFFDDLKVELQNNEETDYFCQTLRGVTLTDKTYFGALNELVDTVHIDEGYPMAKSFFEEYKVWLQTVSGLL